MLRIKRDDKVKIMVGKDKGKTGRVIRVLPADNKVVVENINVVKKAKKPTQMDPQGGFIEMEKPIHASNVMILDKKTNAPTRFGVKVLKDGTKVRISKKTGEVI